MRLWKKIAASVVLAPILIVVGYIAYLWASYIDNTVASGTAYGFTIGSSKQDALASTGNLSDYPHATVYVDYGPRAGDNFTVAPLPSNLGKLQQHDRWNVLLRGNDKFFDSVRLTFRNGKLVEIYRHRQNFELP